MAAQRIVLEVIPNQRGQRIESLAHIGQRGAHVNTDAESAAGEIRRGEPVIEFPQTRQPQHHRSSLRA